MSKGLRRFAAGIIAAVVIVLIVLGVRNYFRQGEPTEEASPPTRGKSAKPAPPPIPQAPSTRKVDVFPPVPQPPAVGPTAAARSEAKALMRKGLDLLVDDRAVPARISLAEALNTGALDKASAETARRKLAELADETLFSSRPFRHDPCTGTYRFQSGDVLTRVERKLKLHVPHQLLAKINGIKDPRRIPPGRRLKVIRGPFHAVISKGAFTLDVYLEEKSGPKTSRMIFVRRFPVAVGKNDATPTGKWRVVLGGKTIGQPWTPPSSSELPREQILRGDPRYPFGRKGYWISLEGIAGNPHTKEDGYGIHDTNEPDSIGKAASLGCIRLKETDMEQLFFMLYEHWSTVTIVE